jgi:hypothetical protein
LTKNTKKGVCSSYGSGRAIEGTVMAIKMFVYFIALFVVLLLSWQIQAVHLGMGYTLGLIGLLVAFFVAINALTKDSRK